MVSAITIERPCEPKALSKPAKPPLQRPLSGIIRKSDDAHLSDQLLSTPTKRARVTFNPDVEEKVMEAYSVKGRSAEAIRVEVRRAIESHKRGNSGDYDALKDLFTPSDDAEPGDDDEESDEAAALARVELKTYLAVLTNHVSLMKGCTGLVRAILSCNWVGRDTGFVKAYIQFLNHLASAQGSYVGLVLGMLVDNFHGVRISSGRLRGYPDVNRHQLSTRIHTALKHFLGVIPAATSSLSEILATKFPFADDSKQVHMVYIHNLMHMLTYAPHLKSDVFALIMDKLVKIDVQMQVDLDDLDDEVAAAIVHAISLNPSSQNNDHEADASDNESVTSDDALDAESKRIKEVQSNVEKMDAILDLLFTTYTPYFLDPHSHDATEMFENLLAHFQRIILPTYRSRHTQFILFHFSQTADYLVDQFAGTCAQLAFDSNHPAVLRQSAAAYLASFVARGIHVQPHVVRTVFELIGNKLDGIRAENEITCRGPNLRRYSTFYAMTQALLYIFCFRWRDLLVASDGFHDDEDADVLSGQDLQWIPGIKETLFRTIHSKLNPLKICSPPIVAEFAKIAKHLEFMQVYPLLETNKRIRLSQYASAQASGAIRDPSVPTSDESWHQLDAYFPFDPYQLPVSKKWIEGDYIQWKGIPGLNQDEDDDSEDEVDDENVDGDIDSEDTATDNDDE